MGFCVRFVIAKAAESRLLCAGQTMQITKDADVGPTNFASATEKLQNRQSKRQLIGNNAKATKQKHRGERSARIWGK